MLTILHGENTVASRNRLVVLSQTASQADRELVSLDAKKITLANLEEALMSQALFGNEKTVVIENLHSLPRSKKRSDLLDLVLTSQTNCVLWEKKALTPAQKKMFTTAKIEEFKLTKYLFRWLESLQPGINLATSTQQLHKAIDQDSAEMVWFMLIRQVRLLLQAKTNSPLAGPPFMISKITSQARKFDQTKIMALHQACHDLDLQLKSSSMGLDLAGSLDLFLRKL